MFPQLWGSLLQSLVDIQIANFIGLALKAKFSSFLFPKDQYVAYHQTIFYVTFYILKLNHLIYFYFMLFGVVIDALKDVMRLDNNIVRTIDCIWWICSKDMDSIFKQLAYKQFLLIWMTYQRNLLNKLGSLISLHHFTS